MTTTSTEGGSQFEVDSTKHEARITVNDLPVVLTRGKRSGLDIKQAAVNAGVPIQVDFVLSEVRQNGEQKVIPDDREVEVNDGDEFWAIPGDDNS